MALMETLRKMAAGDSMHGLHGQAFEDAARELGLEAKLSLRPATLDRRDGLIRERDEAREQDLADQAARIASAVEHGRDPREDTGPNRPMPRSEAVARRIGGLARELGLRCPDGSPVPAGAVIEALAWRAQILADLIAEDYKRSGQPKGLVEARRALSRARAAEWEARREYEQQQQRYAALRDEAAEREVMAAHAETVKAAAAVKVLRERLAREWAVTV